MKKNTLTNTQQNDSVRDFVSQKSDSLDIAGALESTRHEMGLSKSSFAEKCGISQSFYSGVLRQKKSLNLNTVEKICKSINIPIEILIFKAVKEKSIENHTKRKLIREIRPIMDEITRLLYFDKMTERNTSIANELKTENPSFI